MTESGSMSQPVVLFVCQHGGAKSVIAAALLRELAAKHGIPLDCRSAGIHPYSAVPEPVVQGLRAEAIDVSSVRPQLLTSSLMATADYVIAFGCDLTAPDDVNFREWLDVPAVSDDYTRARDEIASRVEAFFDEIHPTVKHDKIRQDSADAP